MLKGYMTLLKGITLKIKLPLLSKKCTDTIPKEDIVLEDPEAIYNTEEPYIGSIN